MSIILNDNLSIQAPKAADSRFGPYADTATALTSIVTANRFQGLVVGITIGGQVVEYWFRDGTADSNLILKVDNTANTANTLAQGAYDRANTANTLAQSAYDKANTANTLAQGAYDRANTDFTNITITTGTYGNTTFVPVVTVAANGRVTNITNTAISFPVEPSLGVSGTYGNTTFVPVVTVAANGRIIAITNTVISNTLAQGAYDKANTANTLAQAGFDKANTANTLAQSAYDQANTANTLAQSAYNNSNTKLPLSGGTIAGSLVIQNNLTVQGNVSYTGNVTSVTVTGNTGQFFGYASNGFNALYAGIPTGYFLEPQISFQISSNYNGYSGLNMQNINTGSNASSDLFVTADNGTVNDGFLDLGFASSTYNYPGYSLIGKNDGYLFATGNTITGGGNMIVGTGLNNDVIFTVGGINTENEIARFKYNTGLVLKTLPITFADGTTQNTAAISAASSQTIYNKANTANTLAQSAFDKANTANTLAQSAFDKANTANTLAQTGFDKANTANTLAQTSFDKANTANTLAQAAFDKGNTANTLAQSAFDKANTANTLAQSAFDKGNTANTLAQTAFDKANTANTLAQSAFDKGNTANTLAQTAFDKANTANTLAQTAFDKANTANNLAQAAFDKANTANNLAQAAFDKANTGGSSGYLANSIIFANTTGYLSNTNTLKFYTSNNTLITTNLTLSVGAGGQITFADGTTQATAAGGASTDQTARNLANTANTLAQSAFDRANTANNLAQSAFDKANTANNLAQTSFDKANTANTLAQTSFDKANTANTLAQSAFDKANTANNLAQAAFDKANTGGSSGYLANSIIFANTTGYLSNTDTLKFYASNNTLITTNLTLSVGAGGQITFADGTTQATAAGGASTDQTARNLANTANNLAQAAFDKANTGTTSTTTLPLILNDISNQFTGSKSVFTLFTDQTNITSSDVVDSRNMEVIINGLRLAPYIKQNTYPWLTPYDSFIGFRVVSDANTANVIIYNSPAPTDQAVLSIINKATNVQTRKYPYSATTIALGD